MAEKWQENDTLRQMTTKFNSLIDELEQLKLKSSQSNSVTEKKFTELSEDVAQKFNDVTDELNKEIKNNIDGLNLDNLPVSDLQQEAIDAAKSEVLEMMDDRITSTEIGEEIESINDPDVSAPVKEYIIKKIYEALAARDENSGLIEYNVAGTLNLGVVRSSEDVQVDEKTGLMTTPLINQKIEKISQDLTQTIKGLAELSGQVGNIAGLKTDSKTMALAINELAENINNNRVKLAEILTDKGIICSENNSWNELIESVKVLPSLR